MNSIGLPLNVEIRPIPGLGVDSNYYAGDDGHIYCFSDNRVNRNKPQPFRLSESKAGGGYPSVAFYKAGKKSNAHVHRLVCAAFNGAPPEGYITRHLDGTRDNNLPSNLAWGTYADNLADARRHGTMIKGERQWKAKLTEEAVRIIRASIPYGLWNATDAAKVFGVDRKTVSQIAHGKTWEHVE